MLLLLEARERAGWHYALMRFSDSSCYVTHHEKEVWSAVRDTPTFSAHNEDHTYRVFQKRILTELTPAAGEQP